MRNYDDIIEMKYPFDRPSRHSHMSIADRAKIFMPFAALKGYETAIDNTIKQNENAIEEMLIYDDINDDVL